LSSSSTASVVMATMIGQAMVAARYPHRLPARAWLHPWRVMRFAEAERDHSRGALREAAQGGQDFGLCVFISRWEEFTQELDRSSDTETGRSPHRAQVSVPCGAARGSPGEYVRGPVSCRAGHRALDPNRRPGRQARGKPPPVPRSGVPHRPIPMASAGPTHRTNLRRTDHTHTGIPRTTSNVVRRIPRASR
jgi:hypothetical protein